MSRILYLGLDPKRFKSSAKVTHYPIIKIVARPFDSLEISAAFAQFSKYTHVIFTSRSAVHILFEMCKAQRVFLDTQFLIAVGKATAAALEDRGLLPHRIAQEESAEGIVLELEKLDLSQAHIFLPRSGLARPLIRQYLEKEQIVYTDCVIYDTQTNRLEPLPLLEDFDEIVFTSPSTVVAFLSIFGKLPDDKKLTAIGPVTEKQLEKSRSLIYVDR